MIKPKIEKRIKESGVIAVLILENLDHAVPVAEALLEGGVQAMELTLRTPVALSALKAIKSKVPNMLAGVGTILNVEQVKEVAAVGADFGVSPGCNPKVLAEAKGQGLSFAPGIATPTDIEQGLEYGCRIFKFFPAGTLGGLPYLKSMAAPYLHLGIEFIPLGGVRTENMDEYLKSPLIAAVGGSWLAPKDILEAEDWPEITRKAREAREKISNMNILT